MSTPQSSNTGPDLELGRLAQQQRDQGRSWAVIADDLEETSPSYVARAARAYLDHTENTSRANQLELF